MPGFKVLIVGVVVVAAVSFSPPVAPGPELAGSFAALGDDNGGVPPDPQGAVGPDRLMVALNTQIRIEARDGTPLLTMFPSDFWAPVAFGGFTFDPRILYDPFGQRWIFITSCVNGTRVPAILLAVSQTPDPGAGWYFFSLPVDPAGTNYAEFPQLGFNQNWICIAANIVSATTNTFQNSRVWVIPKSDVYAGKTPAPAIFGNLPGSSLKPVVTEDAGEADEFVVGEWSGDGGGVGELQLLKVTATDGIPRLVSVGYPQIPATWNDSPVPLDSCPQAGTPVKITADQDEVPSATLRNGILWVVQTVTIPAGVPFPHTAIQWWKINPSGSVANWGRIDDPSGNYWLTCPSIAVSRNDDVLIGYSYFSAGTYASAGYSLAAAGQPLSALGAVHTLKAGEAPYIKRDANGYNRWGDLSEAVVDPVNDRDLWTIQEYAAASVNGVDQWGTWWGEISPSRVACGVAARCVTPVTVVPPVPVRGR